MTFNRVDLLTSALASVQAQTYGNLEILVSDNHSTDHTSELVRTLAAADPRIRYVRRSENVGPEANFARALHESHGELFMWLADDDWIAANYVSECVAQLTDQVRFSAGEVRYWNSGRVVERDRPASYLEASPARRILRFAQTGGRHGWYYGLGEVAVMRRAAHHSTLGGDFLFLTELLALTRVGPAPTVLNRRLDGESSDIPKLAQRFGLSRAWGKHHFLWIGLKTTRHLLTGRNVLGEVLSPRERIGLAPLVFAAYSRLWFGHSLVAPAWRAYATVKRALMRKCPSLNDTGPPDPRDWQ